MQNQLIENLFIYKKTAVLLAAFQLGLFRQIREHGPLNEIKCCRLGWNKRYSELLCIYLTTEGYLVEVDGSWEINKDFEIQLDTFERICQHESTLYHKWLSPELIALSVKSIEDSRPFDKEGFNTKEQHAYDAVMYSDNINLIALRLLRKIKRDIVFNVRCLEYGRSDGRIGNTLRNSLPEMSLDTTSFDQTVEGQRLYDVIIIYNTIHYKSPTEWETIFHHLKNLLDENGFICIADVFYRQDNVFQSTVLLDWLTHGGIFYLDNNEVMDKLRAISFSKVEQRYIDSISTDLFYAYK